MHDAVIRLVLADERPDVRDRLRLLLTAGGEVDVVACVGDGAQALEQVLALSPDIALLGLHMPVMDGAEATAAIARTCPDVGVLVLTTVADDDAVLPALCAGAVGYLTEDAAAEQVRAAVRDVAAGHTVLDPSVQKRLLELLRAAPPPAASTAAPWGNAARAPVVCENAESLRSGEKL